MQFVFQSLAWGFLLVLVPLLIHLINLLRYRRQRWAAMQFLLESYRRHKRWVWLKQALLLLSRMAVLAVLVAMLAQWVSGAKLLSLLGQSVTHHYIVLDDSMSMGQQTREGTVYDLGIRSISNLIDRAVSQGGSHQITVLRASRIAFGNRASTASAETPSEKLSAADSQLENVDALADILSRSVLDKTGQLLAPLQNQGVVDLDVDILPAIQLTNAMLPNADLNENAIVYLVSDFRTKDWNQPSASKAALKAVQQQGARVELVDCADTSSENISLVSLQPDQEVLAAGVPVLLRLSIRNQGTAPLRNVSVKLTTYDFHSRQLSVAYDQFSSGIPSELPALIIENIDPAETAVRSVQVLFAQSGNHVVSASIGEDALRADNRIACVLNLVDNQKLLIVDDSTERRSAVYLRAALDPGGTAKTGWQSSTESTAFLRDSQLSTLQNFAAILLADVRSLDERAVRNLRQYVAAGGGLAIFPGPQWTTADAIRISQQLDSVSANVLDPAETKLAQTPLLPIRYSEIVDVAASQNGGQGNSAASAQPALSMAAKNHPIFGPLLGLSASPFQFLRFGKYALVQSIVTQSEVAKSGSANTSELDVIASLGNSQPLMFDQSFGEGHVIGLTTAIDPKWNNWASDPSFVVVMLKTSGYLASFRRAATSGSVIEPIDYTFAQQQYLPDTEIVYPGRSGTARQSRQMVGQAVGNQMMQIGFDPLATARMPESSSGLFAGMTELWLSSINGGREVINFAGNASAIEGELMHMSKADLLDRLQGVEVSYRTAQSAAELNPFSAAAAQQNWLLGLLILLLLVEQLLAYLASYHLPQRATANLPVKSAGVQS